MNPVAAAEPGKIPDKHLSKSLRGGYRDIDVLAASRTLTGWVEAYPHLAEVEVGMRLWALTSGLVLLVALCFLGGCDSQRTFDAKKNLTHGDLRIELYDQGRVIQRGTLAQNSAALEELQKLLEKQGGRWKENAITYAPTVVVRNDDTKISLLPGWIVVNYLDSAGNPVQIVGTITAEEYDKVRRAIEGNLVVDSPSGL